MLHNMIQWLVETIGTLGYTSLGASIWCAVLTWIGYAIGDNQQLIMSMSRQATAWAICGCLLVLTVYLWLQRKRSNSGNLLPVTSTSDHS